jgi:hypothetical protein
MKKKSFLSAIVLLVSALVSCQKDSLYLQVPGTCWTLSNDSQDAYISFHDGTHVSVLQTAKEKSLIQTLQGTYVTDGHRVDIAGSDGSAINLVRTFTHLKNSKNKNFSQVKPESWESVAGSIWASVRDNNLYVVYFPDGERCANITYRNVSREEGVHYGWDAIITVPYELSGNQLKANAYTATLYKSFLTFNNTGAICVNSGMEEKNGSSVLEGTIWAYNNTGYPADTPGIIIFHSPTRFTRIMGMTAFVLETVSGAYSVSGDTVKMTIDGKSESCLLSGNSFTFFERKYRRMDY